MLILVYFLLYQGLHAQDIGQKKRKAKAIYVEVLGMSPEGISVNYDMRFKKGRNDGLGFRMGAGYGEPPGYSFRYQYYFLPVMLNQVIGNKRIAFETGLGSTIILTRWRYDIGTLTGQPGQEHSFDYKLYANLGFRLQPIRSGILFRLYWAPIFEPEGKLFPYWAGASIGVGFK